jgi:hypothetical protein
MRCISTDNDGRLNCSNEATHSVARTSTPDRKGHFCEKHAAPYMRFPSGFRVLKIVTH